MICVSFVEKVVVGVTEVIWNDWSSLVKYICRARTMAIERAIDDLLEKEAVLERRLFKQKQCIKRRVARNTPTYTVEVDKQNKIRSEIDGNKSARENLQRLLDRTDVDDQILFDQVEGYLQGKRFTRDCCEYVALRPGDKGILTIYLDDPSVVREPREHGHFCIAPDGSTPYARDIGQPRGPHNFRDFKLKTA